MHKHTKLLWLAVLAIGAVSAANPREKKQIRIWNNIASKTDVANLKKEIGNNFASKTEVANMRKEIGASMHFAQKDVASIAEELRLLTLRLNKEDGRAVCSQPQRGLGIAACVNAHGAWTVIQRRTKGDVLFSRGWEEYLSGFGDIQGDYWIGLNAIYEMCPQYRPCEARFEMTYQGKPFSSAVAKQGSGHYVARYGTFGLAGPADKFRLTIGNFDSVVSTVRDDMSGHNRRAFSTKDVDNDDHGGSCSRMYGFGGWWYNQCHQVNFNGKWKARMGFGLSWVGLTDARSVDSSKIMIRQLF